MNKNNYLMLLQCYDEMADVLTIVLKDYRDNPSLSDDIVKSRMMLLKSKSIVERHSVEIVKR